MQNRTAPRPASHPRPTTHRRDGRPDRALQAALSARTALQQAGQIG